MASFYLIQQAEKHLKKLSVDISTRQLGSPATRRQSSTSRRR